MNQAFVGLNSGPVITYDITVVTLQAGGRRATLSAGNAIVWYVPSAPGTSGAPSDEVLQTWVMSKLGQTTHDLPGYGPAKADYVAIV